MIPPQQPEEADETVEAPAAAEEPAEEPAREPAAPAAEEGKAEEPAPAPATDAPMQTPFSWAPPRPWWARTASWTPPALPLRRISATGMTWAAADKQNQYGLLCASRSKRGAPGGPLCFLRVGRLAKQMKKRAENQAGPGKR